MEVLRVLMMIWSHGGDVVKNDGDIDLINHENVPKPVIDSAIQNIEAIQHYIESWEKESKVNLTIRKALLHICGWQHNEKLLSWLREDINSVNLFYEWTVALDENGWSLYEDFRSFESDESNKLKIEFYNQAIALAKVK